MEPKDNLFMMLKKDVFGIDSNIDIFITKPMTWATLAGEWKNIRNVIASQQRFLDDEFERWNHYLFYLVEGGINENISLKHVIEHDTISSRKVIISAEDFKEDDFDAVIGKYISYRFENGIINELPKFEKRKRIVEMMEED